MLKICRFWNICHFWRRSKFATSVLYCLPCCAKTAKDYAESIVSSKRKSSLSVCREADFVSQQRIIYWIFSSGLQRFPKSSKCLQDLTSPLQFNLALIFMSEKPNWLKVAKSNIFVMDKKVISTRRVAQNKRFHYHISVCLLVQKFLFQEISMQRNA